MPAPASCDPAEAEPDEPPAPDVVLSGGGVRNRLGGGRGTDDPALPEREPPATDPLAVGTPVADPGPVPASPSGLPGRTPCGAAFMATPEDGNGADALPEPGKPSPPDPKEVSLPLCHPDIVPSVPPGTPGMMPCGAEPAATPEEIGGPNCAA